MSLAIEDGELVTLLGPSGCGKTTLLRIIAGFIKPSSGRILLQGRDVTRLPPHKRPVNMVFQRATLFPHLDVYGNVAFGLQIAGLAKEEVASRVSEALSLVRLEGYEHRRAHELSGGQMQRVALARALVNRPRVLLLDEPLSALDLKIRLEMEAELRRVHRETGATFVYVTHDQREALALSDRIVVFDDGRVEQVGPPGEIYRSPASRFAAQFVGDANVIPVDVIAASEGMATVRLPGRELAVPLRRAHRSRAGLARRPARGRPAHARRRRGRPGEDPGRRLSRRGVLLPHRGTGARRPRQGGDRRRGERSVRARNRGHAELGRLVVRAARPRRLNSHRTERSPCSSTSSTSAAGRASASRSSTTPPGCRACGRRTTARTSSS